MATPDEELRLSVETFSKKGMQDELAKRALCKSGNKSALKARLLASIPECDEMENIDSTPGVSPGISNTEIANELQTLRTSFDNFKSFAESEINTLLSFSRTLYEQVAILKNEKSNCEHDTSAQKEEIKYLRDENLSKTKIIEILSNNKDYPTPPAQAEFEPVVSKSKGRAKTTAAAAAAAVVSTENRFRNLAFVNNSSEDTCSRSCHITDSFLAAAPTKDTAADEFVVVDEYPLPLAPTKRPSLVVSEQPDPMPWAKQRVVPGEKAYSSAHKKSIAIVSDSMCSRFNERELSKSFNSGDILLRKFTGATAPQILHYSMEVIESSSIDGLCVVAGTNDISQANANARKTQSTVDAQKIAEDIIKVGANARNHGVNNVYISSIVKRKGIYLDRIRMRVNRILEDLCVREGFIFINHDNITIHDLFDNVHLNNIGLEIFSSNLLKNFNNL